MGMKDTIISFALLGLFIFCFIAFVFQVSLDNNPSSEILTDSALNKSFVGINSSLNTFTSTAKTELNASNNENLEGGTFGLISFAIIGSVRNFINIITGTYYTLTTLASETIHINPIIINILLAIILVSIIFMAWRIYRQGQ